MNKKSIAVIALILLIMGISCSFRILVHHSVNTKLGESYLDPETGVPYLTEMDSYYHLRMTKDIALYGHAGETVKDGKAWDGLSYAPYGRSAYDYRPLMAYIAVYAQKFLSLFTDLSLDQVAYWQGTLLSALVVIPVFLLVFRLKGFLAAIVSSLLASINYGYFVHTVPGFYDTDTVISWTSCFLLFSGVLLVESLKEKKQEGNTKALTGKRIAYGVLFLLSFLALLQSWYIYYMYAALFAGALFIYLLLAYFSEKKAGKITDRKVFLIEAVFLAAFVILIVCTNPDLFGSLFRNLKNVFLSTDGLFPNALISISEMRKPALIAGGLTGLFQMKVLSGQEIGIINAIGGMIPFLAALAMCVILIVKTVKKEIRFVYILLILWFLITGVLAIRSWRFIMLFAVSTAILAGLFVGTICELMRVKKMMDHRIFAGMIVILTLFPAVYGAYRSSLDSVPAVNRNMHETLIYIREHTGEDTILASWWDYGYFFEEKSRRRTLFDGGSQSGERVFWVGRAFATEDETLSANIFRMLAGSGDDATDKMLELFGESRDTLQLMDELLRTDHDHAKERLIAENISKQDAETLSDLLFPQDASPVALLITPDMPRITGWFAQFGYYGDPEEKPFRLLMDRTAFTPKEGKTTWQIDADGETVLLHVEQENGTYRAYTGSKDQEGAAPSFKVERLFLIQNGKLYDLPQEQGQAGEGYTVVLNTDGTQATISLMSSDIADSVFGRLFYLGGAGLTRYVPDTKAPGSAALYMVEKGM